MRYSTRYRSTSYSSGSFPPGVKWLIIVNVVAFLMMYFAADTSFQRTFLELALESGKWYQVWRLVTYLFLHGGVWHLLVNMFTLWMFGRTLEAEWGTRQFLRYYFLCGIGAGICDLAVNAMLHNWGSRTIGASGAIYGLLLAFGVLYPNQTVLFNFLFPIRAKYFVMIYGALALLGALNMNSGVSDLAIGRHGGGFVCLARFLRVRLPGIVQIRGQYNQWKLQRAEKEVPGVYAESTARTGGPG